jgi:methylglutaconyl-CoA hydratase
MAALGKPSSSICNLASISRASNPREVGMVNHAYPDAELEARVEAFVASLASRSASAMSLTKNLLYRTERMSFEDAIDAGVRANALARITEDARKGFSGFLKKSR